MTDKRLEEAKADAKTGLFDWPSERELPPVTKRMLRAGLSAMSDCGCHMDDYGTSREAAAIAIYAAMRQEAPDG